ncbi:hypothetical protein [Oxalicibacterium flavum]|uniref:hypothetical protein n=1 Tax=Oxalicibacterium flavum TaxID=179467 RepID=UPI001664ED38
MAAPAPDRDAFFVAADGAVLRAAAVVFNAAPAAGLPVFLTGAATLAGAGFAVLAALERAAAGALAFVGAGDFTALLAVVFFAGVAAVLAAVRTVFFGVAADAFTAGFAAVLPAAGLALPAAIVLGADFPALFTAFVTVAFIVFRP